MSVPQTLKTILVVAVSTLLALVLVEIGGRLMIDPDERGYGTILGVLLPPYEIVTQGQARASDRRAWVGGMVVDGHRITLGDLVGYHRVDPVLGYTHLENTTSVNGWWHSNDIGAREIEPTTWTVPSGMIRWLLLGESFAHGSGLPTDQVWANVLEASAPSLDIVNLAVDGYGMGQAYLRYKSLPLRLEHHGVLLMFVPAVDLWRDVNTLRTLGEPWKVQTVMPRFVLEDGDLRLVPGLYADGGDLFEANKDGLSPTLRQHLQRYDRFYFPFEHGQVPVVDHLLTFKIAAAAYGRYERGSIRRSLWKPGSDALRISVAIFSELQRDTASHGREFLLIILPTATDLRRLHEESTYQAQWSRLVAYVCDGPWRCLDLLPALKPLGMEEIDLGPDGGHYGPRVNRRIAAAVLQGLDNQHLAAGE